MLFRKCLGRSFVCLSTFGLTAVATVACNNSNGTSSTMGTSGGSGSSSTGTGPTGADACASYAKSICEQSASCTPFTVTATWGDAAGCEKELAAGCLADLGTNGITATPTALEACATAIAGLDCKTFTAGSTPAACVPIGMGSRPNAASCGGGNQCASGFCKPPAMPGCGTCAAVPKFADTCVPGACGVGLYCDPAGKCAKPLADGAVCKVGVDLCQSGACVQGKCGAPLEQGATCAPADLACDLAQGLACNPISLTCKAIALADAGGACGYDKNTGTVTVCKAGLVCNSSVCAAGALDGQSCTTMPADNCVLGERCINSKCSAAEQVCQ